ncbi:MAG: hypothetical protein ACQEXX_28175 [Bacillota bacterium]
MGVVIENAQTWLWRTFAGAFVLGVAAFIMIIELTDPRFVIVVAAYWVIGFGLKRTPKILDWSILYIIPVLAVGLTTGLLGWTVEAILQGILAGALCCIW